MTREEQYEICKEKMKKPEDNSHKEFTYQAIKELRESMQLQDSEVRKIFFGETKGDKK